MLVVDVGVLRMLKGKTFAPVLVLRRALLSQILVTAPLKMPLKQGTLTPSLKYLSFSIPTSRAVSCQATRTFSNRLPLYQDVQGITQSPTPPFPPPSNLDPERTFDRKEEKELLKSGVMPIGSRRRRAALAVGGNVPFEQLPYQCFQEARKILQADREEKVELIEIERQRIARLEAQDPYPGTAAQKQLRLQSMRKHLEYLKIQADINDPIVKKKFEDGKGIQSTFLLVDGITRYFELDAN